MGLIFRTASCFEFSMCIFTTYQKTSYSRFTFTIEKSLSKAEVRNKGVYLVIIASLLFHVAVLYVLNFVAVRGNEGEEDSEAREQLINLDFVELEIPEAVETGKLSEEEQINNLIADANSEYVSEKICHHSESDMQQRVYEQLKDLEQQFFEEAHDQRSEEEVLTYESELADTDGLEKYEYMVNS